ncbi:von Willebrand factor type A domain-containing protein [Chaetomium fimeti]|uniref:von Willebrand factor type A domain-containing protein n=1 Tax=Chaetomium fimeti TaxID=1854472 RepID=A0AAE0HLM2_9PEZI|nr:von Willebrand factor type A domain-containing protein [Chaetomium fimeti]
MARSDHICGLYYVVPGRRIPERKYLPQLSLSAETKIVSSTSRTTLTQNFVNPRSEAIPELRYTFPLYEGVSVVGFVCTINGERVIRGVVKERAEAKQTYQAAVDRGETAGLLEQLPEASDVFTTTVGNVPADATLKVEIVYLGELKQDVEVDGTRFTIPTGIAPRYGNYPGELLSSPVDTKGGISIVVDVEMPDGSNVKNVQSPSHPISVTLGNTSAGAASGADMSLRKASATLTLSTTELSDDFVLQVVATNTGNPIAVLETHPTLANHRALMATLVPKFNLPSAKPEIVFLCDRSGSMNGPNIKNLKAALCLFLKSLPVGVKFNICSFGSRHEFLFKDGSHTYDQSSLEKATRYVDSFGADFGGTDIYRPMEDVIKKRYADMDLEVFLLTDGEIWDQSALFELLNKQVAESKGHIRVFTLGIGSAVSHALIEGVARAGNGFSQVVGDNEKMNSKVVRMLKASLMPHINDYTLEVKYADNAADSDEDFEMVEKVMDGMTIDVREAEKEETPKKPTSLFDEAANPDVEMSDASLDTSAGGKYSHVPPISEPKFLQAPFLIPALFPFNRTSVYLLLSPETAQKQPKSVVVRGTSIHGPVELEVPVTVLAEKSETIHQLAARKAVKELEEGRGWIYHAKDTAGSLLKDQYPGRFKDMVEREAVRLGVTYQVGGKWCSFVAVEGNEDPNEAQEPTQPSSNEIFAHKKSRSRLSKGGAVRHRAIHSSFTSTGVQGESVTMAAQPRAYPAELRRSRAPETVAIKSSSRGILPAGTTSAQSWRPPPPAAAPAASDDESDDDAMGFGLMDSGGGGEPHSPIASPSSAVASLSYSPVSPASPRGRGLFAFLDDDDVVGRGSLEKGDVLDRLVALQSFEGAWRWEGRVLGLVGLLGSKGKGGGEAGGVVTEKAAAAGLGAPSDVLATALVLVFLEGWMGERRDEWEMVADKARGWLEGRLVDEGQGREVDGLCEKVKVFLQKERVVGE